MKSIGTSYLGSVSDTSPMGFIEELLSARIGDTTYPQGSVYSECSGTWEKTLSEELSSSGVFSFNYSPSEEGFLGTLILSDFHEDKYPATIGPAPSQDGMNFIIAVDDYNSLSITIQDGSINGTYKFIYDYESGQLAEVTISGSCD